MEYRITGEGYKIYHELMDTDGKEFTVIETLNYAAAYREEDDLITEEEHQNNRLETLSWDASESETINTVFAFTKDWTLEETQKIEKEWELNQCKYCAVFDEYLEVTGPFNVVTVEYL
jgi:hypothetical protein